MEVAQSLVQCLAQKRNLGYFQEIYGVIVTG
jgi:hypothetical protein